MIAELHKLLTAADDQIIKELQHKADDHFKTVAADSSGQEAVSPLQLTASDQLRLVAKFRAQAAYHLLLELAELQQPQLTTWLLQRLQQMPAVEAALVRAQVLALGGNSILQQPLAAMFKMAGSATQQVGLSLLLIELKERQVDLA